MVVETTCHSRLKEKKRESQARSLEPAGCAKHEEKLIYRIRKKQIFKNDLNLGKKFPKYKMGAYSAWRHKATVDLSQTWK